MASSRGVDSRLVVGIIFLLVGLYFLLNNFDLIPFELPNFITSWQASLILIGLLLLTNRERRVGGIVLITIGVVFLLPDFFDISVGEIIRQFWPLALVIIGVALLLRRSRGKRATDYLGAEETADYIDETSVLGSNDQLITSQNFRGGKITSILGSNELNFVNARLAGGAHELDLFILFGSTELTIPSDWNIQVDVTPILGSFEDRRRYRDPTEKDVPQLVIKGLVLFGSGELMSV